MKQMTKKQMNMVFSALIAATMVASCSYAPAFAAPKETSKDVEVSNGIEASKGICEMNAELAESMMNLYQKGVPLRKILEIGQSIEGASPSDLAAHRNLTLRMADTPVYNTKSYQERAVAEFSNKVLMDCYKAYKE